MSAEHASTSPDKTRLRFWFRTYAAVAAMEREISARLRERFGCSLGRFDLMAHLFAAPEGLTMSELSDRRFITGGAVTGLVERLAKDGLVLREVDATDRRVYRVVLTARGQALFTEMAGEHETWVEALTEGLQPRALEQATVTMETWRRRLAGAPR